MNERFELVESMSADVEKTLARHKKNIAAYARGVRTAGAQLYGYAFLAGREMLAAKEIVPHGNKDPEAGFKHWIQTHFPEIAYCTSTRWMRFSEELEKSCTVQLFPAKGKLLTNGLQKISVKNRNEILDKVPAMMDGKTMLEFMRDSKLAREPEVNDYWHHSKEELDSFLNGHHPELAGKSYKELAPEIQAELRKWVANARKPTAADQQRSADYDLGEVAHRLRHWISSIDSKHYSWVLGSLQIFDEVNALRIELGRKMDALRKQRKP